MAFPDLGGARRARRVDVAQAPERHARARRARRPARPPRRDARRARGARRVRLRGRRGDAGRARASRVRAAGRAAALPRPRPLRAAGAPPAPRRVPLPHASSRATSASASPSTAAVWAPSRVTQASFTKVRAAWPYRASLDCVVEAPDGRFAAYCHVWPDDENARRRARAGRRPLRLPPARPRRRRLHVRAAAPVRGGRARGDRLLRVGARVRALPVDRLRPALLARRLRARMNRLAHETSPYLLQHADNPVDWYPWGEEAFARARAEDKPILLSIGYAACHWCHVMAHESFEDEATAALMNERFVSVKVDREERPDVDALYMDAVVALTGPGRLADDGVPDAGRASRSSAARTSRPSRGTACPSFRQLLVAIAEAYRDRREDVAQQAAALVDALRRSAELDAVARAAERRRCSRTPCACSAASSTRSWGGFGRAPKFPPASTIEFLLRRRRARRWRRRRSTAWRPAACTTSSAAASTATPSTTAGSCRTSRRCSTTTRCSSRAYLHAWVVTGDRALPPRSPRRRSTTWCASCGCRAAASPRRRTRTPTASKG